jgi:ParB family transcriptional regulator, chromosome partitioning protein
VPGKRRGFYDQAPVDTSLDLLRERNVETLMQPLMQSARTIQRNVPIERIRPNPFQARRTFVGIDELAQGMRTHGFISRLRVRPDPVDAGYFQLVYGERRWRAAQAAGLTELPCDVAEHTDEELVEIGLLENIQREDLNPVEEAQMLKRMIDLRGYSIRSLAERLGKSKGYVDNRLALLRAPEDVQDMVVARPDTIASARLIAQVLTVEERQPLIDGLTSGSIAAKDVRQLLHGASSQSENAGSEDMAPKTRAAKHQQTNIQRQPLGSQRTVEQATHILETMMAQLEATIPLLTQADRSALLDYVLHAHFPRVERMAKVLEERLPEPDF